MRTKRHASRPVPFERPSTQPDPGLQQTISRLNSALNEGHDDRYPPHDEEQFQEGYPRKGNGGYGSPGEF